MNYVKSLSFDEQCCVLLTRIKERDNKIRVKDFMKKNLVKSIRDKECIIKFYENNGIYIKLLYEDLNKIKETHVLLLEELIELRERSCDDRTSYIKLMQSKLDENASTLDLSNH